MDVATSPLASRFYKTFVNRVAADVIVDFAFLFEGHELSELPEELIGVAHLAHLSPDLAIPLDRAPATGVAAAGDTWVAAALPTPAPALAAEATPIAVAG